MDRAKVRRDAAPRPIRGGARRTGERAFAPGRDAGRELHGRSGAGMSQERDLVCLLKIQSGETRALAELFDRYTPLLYPVVRRILRTAADSDDALQEAWLQVWKRSVTYDARRGTVAAWLLTVARCRALDRYRSVRG